MCECDNRYLTLKQAAFELNLPYFKLQRAAKRELFPTYKILNSRPLVRIADIKATIESSRRGGAQ
jgi:hypothetical protein